MSSPEKELVSDFRDNKTGNIRYKTEKEEESLERKISLFQHSPTKNNVSSQDVLPRTNSSNTNALLTRNNTPNNAMISLNSISNNNPLLTRHNT